MTSTTVPAATTRSAESTPDDSAHRVSFGRVVRSEAIKLFTLRSTWWSLGVTALLGIGISLMMASAIRDFGGGMPPTMAIVAPMQFTMLVAGIFGAIAVTGEYSTGMIRSTLTAQPRRGVVVAAKSLVVAIALAVTTIVAFAVAVVFVTMILGADGLDWSDPEQTLIPLLWGVVSMATFALLGLGWGFIIRNGAGAIAATVGVLFVLPIVLNLFAFGGEAWSWIVDLGKYLPVSAAQVLTTPGAEGVTEAVVTLFAWPVAAIVLGWAVLRTRDA